MESKLFDWNLVNLRLQEACNYLQNQGDVPCQPIWQVLLQFTKLFADMGTIMSTAFSDVTQKVSIMKQNWQKMGKTKGFMSFIQKQMDKNLCKQNGNDGGRKQGKYCSTARSLLRQMWFMTFLKVLITDTMLDLKKQRSFSVKIVYQSSEIFNHAYDEAFQQRHNFFIRNGAKLAIKMTSDKKNFIKMSLKGNYNQKLFIEFGEIFIKYLSVVHKQLFDFYKKYNLLGLP